MSKYGVPKQIVTDKLHSYKAALKEINMGHIRPQWILSGFSGAGTPLNIWGVGERLHLPDEWIKQRYV